MDGDQPAGALVEGTNGYLYGTTFAGGTNGGGTILRMTLGGTLTTLYNFCSQTNCTDGAYPQGALIQATNGDLYGTTYGGGTGTAYPSGPNSAGTIFRITPGGTFFSLYSFCSQPNCTDGSVPFAGLVQATNGYLYGTTYKGGTNSGGTAFKITPSGSFTSMYSSCSLDSLCTDGEVPEAGLVQDSNGYLYGATSGGGASTGGTIFRMPPSGTPKRLYSFCTGRGRFNEPVCPYGSQPDGTLVQATSGDLYGTANSGGANGSGTIYSITSVGVLTALYNFCAQTGCTDGAYPYAPLVQGTDGDFYGTTTAGGANACTDGLDHTCGTVFSLSIGLGQFVKPLPTAGVVGKSVKILGNNLTGTNSVSFNGTAALFRVVSSSEIATSVPAGATTGILQVATPSGTLSSNVPFMVVP
jgi:uncharacterized repeat protein (TIGR03803 family)